MKPYSAVIFDLDGTLLDTLDDLTAALNMTMRDVGAPLHTRDEVRSYVGNGVTRLLELALPGGASHPDFERAIGIYRGYYAAHALDRTAPYPGVQDLLLRLDAAGVPTAVVSNKPDSTTKQLCARFFPTVAAAAGENEAGGVRRKPAPDMVFSALKELCREAGECVYVGDSEVDLLTARAAGMDVISVLWGFRDRAFLETMGARAFVADADELFDLLTARKS